MFKNSDYHQPDWQLVGLFTFLLIFGLAMLSSAGVAVGWQDFHDSYWHLKHQLFPPLVVGVIVFLFFVFFDHRRLKKLALPALLASIFLLALVFIPGVGAPWGSARSWIKIFGFSLQPSEIVKLAYLIYLCSWLSNREDRVKDFKRGFMPFIFVLAIIIILMFLEPDTGSLTIIGVTSLMVYFLAGGKILHLAALSIFGGAALLTAVKLTGYRADRLTIFLHPEIDPRGIGYHINQALLAVGSGSLLGRGFGHSRQKFAYLPEVVGDSIFAVTAEELGFIICSILVLVFLFLLFRGLKIAKNTQDSFGRLLASGIVIWFVFQAFFNIGAIIGILPLTGITLPFISYGGTSLVICLAAAGILVNISRQTDYRPR